MRNIETGNLIVKLLEITSKDKKTSIKNLASKARFSTQMTTDIVDKLSMNRFLEISNEIIIVNRVNRIQLAVEAIKNGLDWERVCRTLGFREFEDLMAEAFRVNNFQVYSRFVFKNSKKRFEIDVACQRDHQIICADCKHWNRSISIGQLTQIVTKQIRRTQMLAKEIKICKRKFNIFDESKILFVPIIITLGESKNRMVKKVPIIPVLALRNFLAEFDLYLKDLTTFKLTPKKLAYQD